MTEQAETNTPPPRRHRPWAILVILLLATWLCILLWRINTTRTLRREVELAGGTYTTTDPAAGHDPLTELLLDHPLRLTSIRFSPGQVNDDWLIRNRDKLQQAQNLTLVLRSATVTDTGLQALQGLENLISLDLYGSSITGSSLKTITSSKNLSLLNVARTRVTDTGLGNARPSFHSMIAVDGRQLTDLGVRNLQNISPLGELCIYGADDAVLQRVQSLKFSGLVIYQDDPQTSCTLTAITSLLQQSTSTLLRLKLIGTNFTTSEIDSLQKMFPQHRISQFTIEDFEGSFP